MKTLLYLTLSLSLVLGLGSVAQNHQPLTPAEQEAAAENAVITTDTSSGPEAATLDAAGIKI